MRAFALLALVVLSAHAQPGFFRDPGDRGFDRGVIRSSTVCTVTVSYNALAPAAVQVSGLTVPCVPTMRQALASAAKVFVLGEPAIAPQYECAVGVAWDLANPADAVTSLAGDESCPSHQSAALSAAAQMTY